ncbi:hypothetical protein HK104_008258, partial [Borealophlyctis nickersoniae]
VKNTVAGGVEGVKNTVASGVEQVKSKVAGVEAKAQTAVQQNTESQSTPYELVSSDLSHPLTSLSPTAPTGLTGDTGTQLCLPAPTADTDQSSLSDDASTRSIAPSSPRDTTTEFGGKGKFEINATYPADPIHPTLASREPSTATIPEEEVEAVGVPAEVQSGSLDAKLEEQLDGGKKPRKVHGVYNKALGKLEVGMGKILRDETLIAEGQERHAAGAAEIDSVRAKAC